MLPNVRFVERDGGLGVVRPSAGYIVVIGASDDGDPAVPTPSTDVDALVEEFAGGDGVEAAAIPISTYGQTSVFLSTGADGSKLPECLAALKASELPYRIALFADPVDATRAGQIETAFTAMAAKNKPRAWIAPTRMPTTDETEAAYLTALTGLHTAFSTTRGSLAAGAVAQISGVDGTEKILPFAYSYAAARARLSPEQNTAALRNGALPGVRLRTTNGSSVPGLHDELVSPGLSDVGFAVARSWSGYGGVWVNQELLAAPNGSDLTIVQRRLVIDIGHESAYQALVFRLSVPILVDKRSGYIAEQEALDIEAVTEAALKAVLQSTPVMVSSLSVVVSRTDNVLATGKLGVKIRLVPLGMLSEIIVDLGYFNPVIANAA